MNCSCASTGYSEPLRRIALPIVLVVFAAWFLAASAAALGADRFFAISYHDVRYDVRGHVDPDQSTVSAANLAEQFQWLADHGYSPVSMARILEASRGGDPLPERAVLITFDDGYRSFYDIVLPLLEEFEYPALLALVTSWLEVPYGRNVVYGSDYKPREDFMSWDQVREVARSPLVEIASHSHDLHKGVVGNPQGNTQPAATTRIFEDGGYETQDSYLERIREDLAASLGIIERNTGWRPRVMVWPFGAYTHETTRIAHELGMQAGVTLEPGAAMLAELDRVPRLYVSGNPDMRGFARLMHRYFERSTIKRSIRLDIGSLDAGGLDAADERLGEILDRVKAFGINTVVLKAFHDGDSDGIADSMYFANRHLPMSADLLNRTAWQLRTRAGVRWIYVWMPNEFGRFDDQQIFDLFEDLGRHVYLTGLFVEAPDSDDGDQQRRWIERLASWRRASGAASGELRVAVGRSIDASQLEEGRLEEQLTAYADVADELFLSLEPSAVVDLPDREALVTFIGDLKHRRESLVDYVLEVPADSGDNGLRAIRRLLAAGFPSVGIVQEDLSIGASSVERFLPRVSLRDHPYRP